MMFTSSQRNEALASPGSSQPTPAESYRRLPVLAERNRALPAVLLLLILFAFGLRLWQLDSVPPGWRDDELINSLVISQKVLDGDLAVYYPDASGHEALYHALNAVMLAIFGPTVAGIRWLNVILGTLTIPLTYQIGRRLVGRWPALFGAAALAVSFWSLMYSRFGLRHISLPVFAMAAFICFWAGLARVRAMNHSGRTPALYFLLAGVWMGLGFYTYFASRGVPLILLAFCIYLALFERPSFRRAWRGFLLMFGVAALLAIPLMVTLGQQPESEARVAELAVPVIEARAGNFQPLLDYTRTTLQMFHRTGDDEWLYNIPNRPLFGPIGALFFWIGVVYHLARFMLHAIRHFHPTIRFEPSPTAGRSAFLLLWWLAGISPAFLSVPPASLSHTILAQPAVYLLAASPLLILAAWLSRLPRSRHAAAWLIPALGILLVGTVAVRDLPAYFIEWPARGNTRFLYRADLRNVADYVAAQPELTDFAISGLLAGPWDRLALEMELAAMGIPPTVVRPRWYHPDRAVFLQPELAFSGYPNVPAAYAPVLEPIPGGSAGGYQLTRTVLPQPTGATVCFTNHLCWETAGYQPEQETLELGWRAERPLTLPPMPLISNPPPPEIYAGPRLLVFAHLLDAGGQLLAADDGLWVDPTGLQAGDQFRQQHRFNLPPGSEPAIIQFGLYDPMTGTRIPATDGRETIRMEIGQ